MPEIQLLQNPGFETGLLAPYWTSTGTVTVETGEIGGGLHPTNIAHTGTKFVHLAKPVGGPAASITQIYPFPILPGNSLRLLFWMKKASDDTVSDITATVTDVFSNSTLIDIFIPEQSQPPPSGDVWLSYEGFSVPLIFGAPLGVRVTVSVTNSDNGVINEADFDDIFLVLNT